MTHRAIFRVEKIKSYGQLKAAEDHNNRARHTANADPERKDLNIDLLKLDKPALDLFREKTAGQNIRKNAVLAVEVLISASPEYFQSDDPKKLQNWLTAQKKFIKENFPHALQAVVHRDETSVHIHVLDLPLNAKGKLDCRSKFGGKHTLAQWQDKAAKAVKHLGIERGIEGSEATHTTIKQFYAEVNQRTPELTKLDAPTIMERLPGTEAHDKRAKAEERNAKLFNLFKRKAAGYDRAQREKKQAEKTAQNALKRLEEVTSNPDYKAFKKTQLRAFGHDLNHNAQQEQLKQLQSQVHDLSQHTQSLEQAVTILGSWLDPQSPPKLAKSWDKMTPEEKTAYQIAWEQWQKREHEKANQRAKATPK